MDARKIVLKEAMTVAIGVAVCTAMMIGVFALLGRFKMDVLWGGLIGAVLSVANFFFLAVIASLAADKAQQQDVAGGQKLIKGSYPIRLIVLALLLIVFAKSGFCNVIALVGPLLFVRPVIVLAEFFRKRGA